MFVCESQHNEYVRQVKQEINGREDLLNAG